MTHPKAPPEFKPLPFVVGPEDPLVAKAMRETMAQLEKHAEGWRPILYRLACRARDEQRPPEARQEAADEYNDAFHDYLRQRDTIARFVVTLETHRTPVYFAIEPTLAVMP